ncbi:MAG: hypothetical protein ACO1RX_18405 [Candidatus Sericytochromatia bacterium]
MTPFKILLLSVGSLLGQVMLEVLASRRQHLTLIGTNSQAHTPANFACDRCYLVPPVAEGPAYHSALQRILESEQPDLILPGRDDDVRLLAHYREQHPNWAHAIPCGSAPLADIIQDKYRCFEWAQARALPFANSLLYSPGQEAELAAFLDQLELPVLAKPRQGFGSQGVYFLDSAERISALGAKQEVLLQEYLGDPQRLKAYFADYAQGMPLFFQIPETEQFSAQGLIGPAGELGPVFCAQSTLIMGRTERFQEITQPELAHLYREYALALRDAGWRGVVNLQAKPHPRTGEWQAFEINLRMSGGTACRLALGFDEMGHLFKAFYPQVALPPGPAAGGGVAYPCFQTRWVAPEWVAALAQTGVFQKPDPSAYST